SSGQLTQMTNARGEATAYVYGATGALEEVQGPLGAAVVYTRDALGRVLSATRNQAAAPTKEYDAANRVVRVTYPSGLHSEFVYDRLHLSQRRDRAGRWSYLTHDSLRRLTSVRDSARRVLQLVWARTGGLDAIVDAAGRRTEWQ